MNDDVKGFGFSGNALKIIAAFFMVIDHVGVIFFPGVAIFRILGRISFPIFAFMIAEGCAYTKNQLRYFLSIFVLGVGRQIVYYLYDGDKDMGILITFSLSILVVYAMQYLKDALLAPRRNFVKQGLALLLFVGAVLGVYFLCQKLDIDYGFCGCMTPALASVFRKPHKALSPRWERLDKRWLHVLMLGVGLVLVALEKGGRQPYSLLALPILLLYSGKRGTWRMKYFFYVFYPVHLLLLQGLAILIDK
ncbi:MAG: hypothetical protein J6B12_02220 [Clostridia bacterium]|nr:hypothetical protein [Clostridia bacterium]